MQKEEIEIQLWDYIDGTCNEQDHKRISSLIASDTVWKATYNELSLLNNNISSSTTIAKLPDNFANRVMENIKLDTKKKRTSLLLDWGLKGVAAFFIISILSTTIYTLAKIDWGFTSTDSNSSFLTFNDIQLSNLYTSIELSNNILYPVSFLVMIMALILIEKFLHRSKLKAI